MRDRPSARTLERQRPRGRNRRYRERPRTIVPALQARGYRLVTVNALLGLARAYRYAP
jgi:hypothetical protein